MDFYFVLLLIAPPKNIFILWNIRVISAILTAENISSVINPNLDRFYKASRCHCLPYELLALLGESPKS